MVNSSKKWKNVYEKKKEELEKGTENIFKPGWSKELESELFSFADQLTQKGIPFMLSYVVEHKGKTNQALLDWVNTNKYRIIQLGDIIGISGSRRKEVLIVNYGVQE